MTLKSLIPFVLLLLLFDGAYSQSNDLNILVFTKTAAFRHKSIPKGISFMKDLAEKHLWDISFTENSEDFTDENLNQYDVLVFLNTSGDLFDDIQKKALKRYMALGNGFVGIHAASNTEMEWSWFTDMIGATFKNHPKVQNATLHINKKDDHPAVVHLNDVEIFKDEWYNFLKPVAKHVNVLASLDEDSYEGKKMNTKDHPITWYHHYDGGRVFYTGMGHTDEIYDDVRFEKLIQGGILWAADLKQIKQPSSKKWTNLFEDDLSENWDVFIGAPHATVKDLDKVDPNSNGKNANPLGLNNDPKNVYTFEKENGENVLRVSGEIYGALTSKQEFENYHLKLQYKWGEKVWEPRLLRKRDSGILYHCHGSFAAFWNVWMASQEFQVQETDVGDYYGLVDVMIDIPSIKKEGEKQLTYSNISTFKPYSALQGLSPNHCNKGFDNENQHGEWNTLELVCYGGTSLHIVNDKVVMALYNSSYKNATDQVVPLTKGRIQIQSEAAEIFYKKAQIKSIRRIPKKFRKQLYKHKALISK